MCRLILALFFTSLSLKAHVLYDGTNFEKGNYLFDLNTDYFSTSSTYSSDGSEFNLDEGESYSETNASFLLKYAYSEKLNFYGGLNYRSVEANYYYNTNSLINVKNSGIESYRFGLDYFFQKNKKSLFSAYGELRGTTYENANYQSSSQIPSDDIVLGDSGNSYVLGGYYTYLSSSSHFYRGHLAYRLPANDLSSEVLYDLDSVWTFNKWGILVGLSGVYSLSTSEFSEASERPVQATRVSALYNSHNRSYLAGKGSLFYQASPKWFLSFNASQVAMGQSTDKGLSLGLSLSYLAGGKSKKELEVIKENKQFKDYRIDAEVTKVSPRGKFVQINAGLSSDINKGHIFDFYETDFYGGNTLVARGVVYESSLDSSIVKIVKLFASKRVETSMTARAK